MSPLHEIQGGRGHRPLAPLVLTLLALLVVVLVIFRVIPLGPVVGGLSGRQARKMLNQAQQMQEASALFSASEIYLQVSANPKVKPEFRREAIRHLVAIYREQPPSTPEEARALEKAYFFAPDGPEKDALRRHLEVLRGRPIATKATTAKPAEAPAAEIVLSMPKGSHIIARVGGETVALEEILYAWSQFNGGRTPKPEELEPFTKIYLDMVLLADETRLRGLDNQPGVIYDLRVKRILALNQVLTRQMIQGLKKPSAAELDQFYKAQSGATPAPMVTVGHIEVKNLDGVRTVGRALRDGQSFREVARKHSVLAGQLKEGYILGSLSGTEESLPNVGNVPGLAARLCAAEDGATTGPLEFNGGWHWFKVVEKSNGKSAPLQPAAMDQVMLNYQKQQLARVRSDMLKELHAHRTINVSQEKIASALQAIPAADKATSPTTTAASLPGETKPKPASPDKRPATTTRTTSDTGKRVKTDHGQSE